MCILAQNVILYSILFLQNTIEHIVCFFLNLYKDINMKFFYFYYVFSMYIWHKLMFSNACKHFQMLLLNDILDSFDNIEKPCSFDLYVMNYSLNCRIYLFKSNILKSNDILIVWLRKCLSQQSLSFIDNIDSFMIQIAHSVISPTIQLSRLQLFTIVTRFFNDIFISLNVLQFLSKSSLSIAKFSEFTQKILHKMLIMKSKCFFKSMKHYLMSCEIKMNQRLQKNYDVVSSYQVNQYLVCFQIANRLDSFKTYPEIIFQYKETFFLQYQLVTVLKYCPIYISNIIQKIEFQKMMKALIIGAFVSFVYTQEPLLVATNTAGPLNGDGQNAKCGKPNKPVVLPSNYNPLEDRKLNKFFQPKNFFDIPIIKDCDTDESEEEKEQKSIIESENCDCSETHRKRCPGHQQKKTTNIIGTWSPLDDTTIQITFDDQGRMSLKGCNINSCAYTLTGRKFSKNELCIGTKRACQVDNDSLYLNLLQSAKFVVSGGKDKIVFLDEHFHKVLTLFRVQV